MIVIMLLYPVVNFTWISMLGSFLLIATTCFLVAKYSHQPHEDFFGAFVMFLLVALVMYFFKTLANVVLFLSFVLCFCLIFIQESISYVVNDMVNGDDIYQSNFRGLFWHFLSPTLSLISFPVFFNWDSYHFLYRSRLTVDFELMMSIIQSNILKIASDNQNNIHTGITSSAMEFGFVMFSSQFDALSNILSSVVWIVQIMLMIYFVVIPLKIYFYRSDF